jgi:hypothetical protein
MTIWHMHISCWTPKATNEHLEYEHLLLFHRNNGCYSAPQCYVIRTLSLLFISELWFLTRSFAHSWNPKIMIANKSISGLQCGCKLLYSTHPFLQPVCCHVWCNMSEAIFMLAWAIAFSPQDPSSEYYHVGAQEL